MAVRSGGPQAAELGRRVWSDLRGRAESDPAQFAPVTHKDVSGWLWDGALASLIREAVPGITDGDLRRAREYLNASGMITNVGSGPRGQGQPQWFIRADWHHGQGGHVHVVSAHQPDLPAAAETALPAVDELSSPQPPQPPQPGAELVEGLHALIQQVSDLQADNDRLRKDNQRLRSQIGHLRAVMRQAEREITRQAGELVAAMED